MTIEETSQIDIIRVDSKTGKIVLDIADHLEWDNENQHLYLLQDKLNAYLNFLKSGEIYTDYPDFRGRGFVINVVFKNPPTPGAIDFLTKVAPIVNRSGFELEHMVFKSE